MRFTKRAFIKTMFALISATIIFIALSQINVYALSESDVQNQVASSSKEAVGGNVFIWFLCAIAFLKISQKIESILGSLGINIGHTGGSMLGEIMIAARGLSFMKRFGGGKSGASSNGSGGSATNSTASSGGFAGAVGRRNPNDPPNSPTNGSNGNTSPGSPTPQSNVNHIPVSSSNNTPLANSPIPQNASPYPISNNSNTQISGSPNPQNVNISAVTPVPIGVQTAGNTTVNENVPQNIAGTSAENGSIPVIVNDNTPIDSTNSNVGFGIMPLYRMSSVSGNITESTIKADNI